MKPATALTLDQSRKLLPDIFQPNARLNSRKKLIQTPSGVIAFHQSSLLREGYWKTSHPKHEIGIDIDYVLFAIGYEGVILLSSDTLLSFEEKNYPSRYANNGYPIHIFKKNGGYFWQGRDGNTMDVTQFFYPYKVPETEKKLEQYKDLFNLWDTNAKIAEQTGLEKEFEREEDEACKMKW